MIHSQNASQLIGLFRDGKDTIEIAKAMNMTEAAVYNAIYAHKRAVEEAERKEAMAEYHRRYSKENAPRKNAKLRAELRRIRAEFA